MRPVVWPHTRSYLHSLKGKGASASAHLLLIIESVKDGNEKGAGLPASSAMWDTLLLRNMGGGISTTTGEMEAIPSLLLGSLSSSPLLCIDWWREGGVSGNMQEERGINTQHAMINGPWPSSTFHELLSDPMTSPLSSMKKMQKYKNTELVI